MQPSRQLTGERAVERSERPQLGEDDRGNEDATADRDRSAVISASQTVQPRTPEPPARTKRKKHVKGEQGTPFSKCVSAVAKLLEER